MFERLHFKRLHPEARLPTRGSAGAAGLDLYAVERVTIEPGGRAAVRTGLAVAVPRGFYGRVAPRSGLAVRHGIDVLAGVIDSDYRGEVLCALVNHGREPFEVEPGARVAGKRAGRLVVRGRVRVVVDAFDQVDGNQPRRRLGLYKLGYQLLLPDGAPAPGFEQPRVQIEFDRLPPDREAPKIVYADESGITVYGSSETRFLYEVTNHVRHGRAERGVWDTAALPPGDYTLRILAADFAGNEAAENRDVQITVVR